MSMGNCLAAPVEPVTGIEPACPAWKAGALPLSYADVLPRAVYEQRPRSSGLSRLPEHKERR